jgi:valyl-tRNA synthetase
VPHLAEELYQSLKAGESVHLADYPASQTQWIDPALEKDMQAVIDVVSLGRTARGEANIKIRQPLGEMHVPAKLRDSLDKMLSLVQEEVNIHNIRYVGRQRLCKVRPETAIQGDGSQIWQRDEGHRPVSGGCGCGYRAESVFGRTVLLCLL